MIVTPRSVEVTCVRSSEIPAPARRRHASIYGPSVNDHIASELFTPSFTPSRTTFSSLW